MIFEGHSRFWAVTVGKASALSVLMMSLSNQLSTVVGVDYFNGPSFLACLVAALLLIALLKPLEKPVGRLALSMVNCVLSATWIVLLCYLQGAAIDQAAVPAPLFILYAFSGRITTFIVNMQWNYQFALDTVDENPRYVATGVLCALVFFLLYLAVGGFFAQLLVIGALATSSLLALAFSWAEFQGKTGPHSACAVSEADSNHPVAIEGHTTIRFLYFGSRSLYGLMLGVLVWLATLASPSSVTSPVLVLAATFCTVASVLFVAGGFLTPSGNALVVILTPLVSLVLICVAFYPDALAHPLCLFAVLGEITWTTQNLFQLPSYRRICKLGAARFAYTDYIAQIVPYYLLVWLLSSSGTAARYLQVHAVSPEALGTFFLVVLAFFSIGAMVRHVVRYLPHDHPATAAAPSRVARERDLVNGAQGLEELTPRERDVFALMAAGYSRSYIGKVLYISPDTVKVHARHIYAKLGITSKDELIGFAETVQTGGD